MTEPAAHVDSPVACGVGAPWAGAVLAPGGHEVNVAGRPAGRVGDECDCAPFHTSALAEGSATVLINGLPAARLGSATADGGRVLEGEPSVQIGGPTYSMPRFITVVGTPHFRFKIYRHLMWIMSTRSGQLWAESMKAAGKRVTIRKSDNRSPHAETDPLLPDGKHQIRNYRIDRNDPRAYDGTGIDSAIYYDPERHADDQLFHEMVHSDDMAHGRLDARMCDNPGGDPDPARCGELRARGIREYADTTKYPYSQNTYRVERGKEPLPVY